MQRSGRHSTPAVKIKRVYAPPTPADGLRILVDRVWPRGISKERARLTEWRKDLAPSTELRTWFGHDPSKWQQFRERYLEELRRSEHADTLKQLAELSRQKTLTLVYGAADERHNQAIVLKEVLETYRAKTMRRRR